MIAEATRLTVRPFRAADYLALNLVKPPLMEGTVLSVAVYDPDLVGRAYETMGRAFTAEDERGVLACAGIIKKWAGLGEAWALVTTRVTDHHGLDLFWAIRAHFDPLVAALGLRRVEADVVFGWARGERLMRLLGFTLEGVMPRYGPAGETFGKWTLFP